MLAGTAEAAIADEFPVCTSWTDALWGKKAYGCPESDLAVDLTYCCAKFTM